MDLSDPNASQVQDYAAQELLEAEKNRSTMISPCKSTNSRSKRPRENAAMETSLDVPNDECKRSVSMDDAQSQDSVFTDSIRRESEFDLDLSQILFVPNPPCPSPAEPASPTDGIQDFQKQLLALQSLNNRLTREMELDRAKSALEQSLLEDELVSLRRASRQDDARPAAQVPSSTPFKRTLQGGELSKSARISLLTQSVQANNAYVMSLLRSPAFAGFKKT